MATIRLLLDEDVPILVATTLRLRGYDALHATEVGLKQHDDGDVFAAAVGDHRTVLTHNVGDFVGLARSYGAEGRRHHGLVFCEQVEFRDLLSRTLTLLTDRDAESMMDAIVWLVR